MAKYKDSLHVPSSELVIEYCGKEVMLLNKALLDQQNCWKNLKVLKALHLRRITLEDSLTEAPEEAKGVLLDEWTQIQFALQKAWGFPEDAKYHRFWDIKGCTCPKIDNNDAYPTGYYITSGGCTVHGK